MGDPELRPLSLPPLPTRRVADPELHPLTLVRDHEMLTDKAETLFEEVQQVVSL